MRTYRKPFVPQDIQQKGPSYDSPFLYTYLIYISTIHIHICMHTCFPLFLRLQVPQDPLRQPGDELLCIRHTLREHFVLENHCFIVPGAPVHRGSVLIVFASFLMMIFCPSTQPNSQLPISAHAQTPGHYSSPEPCPRLWHVQRSAYPAAR